MTRRVKVVAIDECRDCPYCLWGYQHRCSRVMVSGREAEAATDPAGRIIPYRGREIPKWCPLPDAPKEEGDLP